MMIVAAVGVSALVASAESVYLDNVTVTQDISLNSDETCVLTNSAKVSGGWALTGNNSNTRTLITGQGTVLDCGKKTLVVGGRWNYAAVNNEFVISDGAMVTNFGGTAWCYGDWGQNVCGLWGGDSLLELRNGAIYWMNLSGDFRLGYDGSKSGRGGNRFRVLSGSKARIRGLNMGMGSQANLVEVAGSGSSLRVENSVFSIGTAESRHARVWAHDHGELTTDQTLYVGAVANVASDSSLELEDEATFTGNDIYVGASANHKRCVVRVDTGATLDCGLFFVGCTDVAGSNSVWVGDSARIRLGDNKYSTIYANAETTMVISNGAFEVTTGDFSIGAGNTLVFAGSRPQVKPRNFSFSCTTVFRIPAEGIDADHALIRPCGSASTKLGNCTPVFEMRDFIRAGGGTVLLYENTGSGGIDFNEFKMGRAKWEAALTEACAGAAKFELTLSSDNKKLWLTVKQKKGLAIIVR